MNPEPASLRCPLCGAIRSASLDTCPSCGAAAPGSQEAPLQPAFELVWAASSGLPFLSRAVRAIAAAGETAAAMAFRPETTFRRFRVDGGLAGPVLFAGIIAGPCVLLHVTLAARWQGAAPPTPLAALGILILVPPLYIYLRSQALQLTMVLSGRARCSFNGTFRVVGYANASAAPLLLIPVAGDMLFLAAGCILEVTGIRIVHGLRLGDALAVELVPVSVLILALAAAGVVGLLWWSQTRS